MSSKRLHRLRYISISADQGVGNILEELKPIQNITYPATYIARVAHYILRTQGLERSEEGGAVPQVIYVVDIREC